LLARSEKRSFVVFRPQIVRNEVYHDEPETVHRQDTSKQNTRQRPQNQNRSASSSRPITEPTSSRSRDGRRGGPKSQKERPPYKGMRKSDSSHLDASRRMKQKGENGHSSEKQWKEREMLEREFYGLQMASSSKRATSSNVGPKTMNGSTEREN
ncbi:hypothetical protein COOONC_15465, partial [Cooperia oncophora]